MARENEFLKAWGDEVLGVARETREEVKACRDHCHETEKELMAHIARLHTKVAVMGIKVAVMVGGLVIALQLGFKYLLK